MRVAGGLRAGSAAGDTGDAGDFWHVLIMTAPVAEEFAREEALAARGLSRLV